MDEIKRTITTKALIQRINRKLKKEYQALRKSRGYREQQNLGEYYILDQYRNTIINSHVDIESLGREIKVLGDWEVMSKD